MPAQEIQRLSFQREGVRYTIHVEQNTDGTMWGTWNCHDCGQGGTARKSSSTVTEAAAAAEESLERHHSMYHATK
jgi:hypothetical protein